MQRGRARRERAAVGARVEEEADDVEGDVRREHGERLVEAAVARRVRDRDARARRGPPRASSFDGSAWYSKPLSARWTGSRSRVAQRRRAASADSKESKPGTDEDA
ncbi:hypothetical protein JL722_5444 [Aureococcus anophagefferens]|nr:hypothetical protein JL722_5444 [Aureococcus anophagefferens]